MGLMLVDVSQEFLLQRNAVGKSKKKSVHPTYFILSDLIRISKLFKVYKFLNVEMNANHCVLAILLVIYHVFYSGCHKCVVIQLQSSTRKSLNSLCTNPTEFACFSFDLFFNIWNQATFPNFLPTISQRHSTTYYHGLHSIFKNI